MKRLTLPSLVTVAFVLTACSAASSAPQFAGSQTTSNDLIRVDQQGAVVVKVNPLDLEAPAGNLEFDVVLETHSVELDMDLAMLATLTTDTGRTVQATLWDAPRGGHHVSGKLIFPATQDGESILEDARILTLTILNVDAPARVFAWQLK